MNFIQKIVQINNKIKNNKILKILNNFYNNSNLHKFKIKFKYKRFISIAFYRIAIPLKFLIIKPALLLESMKKNFIINRF